MFDIISEMLSDWDGRILLLLFVGVIGLFVFAIRSSIKESNECAAKHGQMVQVGTTVVLMPILVGKSTVLVPEVMPIMKCTK